MSSACLLRSVLLATDLRTPGGAIPARTYRLSTFVGRRHPVMHLQLSLKGKFSSGREGALASKFNYDFK